MHPCIRICVWKHVALIKCPPLRCELFSSISQPCLACILHTYTHTHTCRCIHVHTILSYAVSYSVVERNQTFQIPRNLSNFSPRMAPFVCLTSKKTQTVGEERACMYACMHSSMYTHLCVDACGACKACVYNATLQDTHVCM
jgi:hypothetical protein